MFPVMKGVPMNRTAKAIRLCQGKRPASLAKAPMTRVTRVLMCMCTSSFA